MEAIRLYLADQMIMLQISELGLLEVEDRTVYSMPVKLYKGIDNVLTVLVKNPDQKAIDITAKTFTAELMHAHEQDFIASFPITPTNALKGQAQFTIPANILNAAPIGYYTLVFRCTDTNGTRAVYSNDNYAVAIPVHLQLGYRVPGDVYEKGEDLDLGSIPELVDEDRDLGAL